MHAHLRLERDNSVFRQMASALGCREGDEPIGAMLTQLAGVDWRLQVQADAIMAMDAVNVNAMQVEISPK
jgi:hypothetical protein